LNFALLPYFRIVDMLTIFLPTTFSQIAFTLVYLYCRRVELIARSLLCHFPIITYAFVSISKEQRVKKKTTLVRIAFPYKYNKSVLGLDLSKRSIVLEHTHPERINSHTLPRPLRSNILFPASPVKNMPPPLPSKRSQLPI
jgi:hypothetical protein